MHLEISFTLDMVLVIGVVILALYLFLTERFRVDVTAILIMVTLIILGLVTPEEGVSGFSHPATLIVLGMFVISRGIQKTGLVYIIGRKASAIAGKSHTKQMGIIALLVGPLSGLINNTAMVAIMIPMVSRMAEDAKIAATKLLIPLSFFAMLGGTLTIVGTSTNILSNELLLSQGLEGFSFFEFAKMGSILLFAGLLYFMLIGRFLLPDRPSRSNSQNLLSFLCEVKILENSPLIGTAFSENKFMNKFDVQVVALIRDKKVIDKYISKYRLKEGDILTISGNRNRIFDIAKQETLKILANFNEDSRKVSVAQSKLAKILVTSDLKYRKKIHTAKDFWEEFGAIILGVEKREKTKISRLSRMKFDVGDALLVQATQVKLDAINKTPDFLFLEEIHQEFEWGKIGQALGILLIVILLAAFNVLPLMVAVLLGVVAMILGGFFKNQEEVYESISWDIIFLLAGIIPLSIALQNTGTDRVIADILVHYTGGLPPLLILALFYAITTLLTEIISNNAAVLLLTPIAISSAISLEYNPIAFVLAVTFAASTSFLSPVGYQTNTMVYGVGNYRFSDFWKVGLPLNIILLVLSVFLIDLFWGVLPV